MAYKRVYWESAGGEKPTKINSENLNIMDKGIYDLEQQTSSDIDSAKILLNGKIDTVQSNLDTTNQNVTNLTNNKADKTEIPTKTSDMTNDSDYRTGTQVQNAIDSAISGITGFDYLVVETLPSTGKKGIIYLVPKEGTTNDVYDEYIWLTESSKFEFIGTTQVDLSNYYTKDETNTLLDNKQDTLVSGTNIKTINGNNILGNGDIEIQSGGLPEVYIQNDQPTEDDWKIWINPDEPISSIGTEVVNTLDGNETNMAPSVKTINDIKKDYLIVENKTFQVTLNQNTRTDTAVTGIAKEGYTPIGIVGIDYSNSYFLTMKYSISSDKTKIYINTYNLGSQATATGTLKILYVKD